MISVLNNNTKKSAARAEPAVTIFIIPLQPLTYTNGCKTDMPSRNFYFNPIHQQRCTDGTNANFYWLTLCWGMCAVGILKPSPS
jgi:hypothetical protein